MLNIHLKFLLAVALVVGSNSFAASPKPVEGTNIPEMVDADGTLWLGFGDELLVLPGGLQPSLLCTKTGSLGRASTGATKIIPGETHGLPIGS